MMKKREIAIIAVLLTSCMIPSCQSKPAPADTVTTEASAAAETSAAVTAQPSEYTKPGADYGGEEFTILDYDSDEYFWQAASYSDIHADEETGEPINDAQFNRNRKVEEELNIVLKTHPVGGSARLENGNELRKYTLAGEDYIDVGFVFGSSLKALLSEEGLLQDFNDVPTLNLDASWWDQNAIETFTYGGQLKALTGDVSLYSAFAPMVYFYNKNLADNYGVSDCYDLVREGKWTNDRMMEYCRLVADDLNGDGAMDENDQYGMAEQAGLVADMMVSNGVRFTDKRDDGTLELIINSEKTVKLAELFVTFLNDGQVNCPAGLYSKKYSNVFYEMHLPMFKNNQILFNYQQLLVAMELRAMEADFGLLPTPKYDETQQDYCISMSMSFQTFLCIPATNSDLAMTGNVLDALGYWSQQYVTPQFIDTTVRSKSLRDEDSAEMLELILASKAYDIVGIYNWGNIRTMINNLGYKNNVNFASEYAKIESTVKTEMEKTFAK